MPRPEVRSALIGLALAAATAVVAEAQIDPHLDPTRMLGGCSSCHQGHGLSRSPMLSAPQKEVCLACHDSRAGADQRAGMGQLSADARPQLLGSALAQPFTHPLTDEAFSRHEPDAVTCTSCHTPHRGMRSREAASTPAGRLKPSTRDPLRFEYELCQGCHGSEGAATQSPLDLSRLTNPNSRSSHPIEAPALETSPSVQAELTGQEINCSDCHGNSDADGPVGPHGSSVRYILSQQYSTVDGNEESETTYALCYSCHDREAVLERSPFPLHQLHVIDARASCATCHSAHGSVDNRALIRFGEETFLAGVAASISTGRLAFFSDAPGTGSCSLTCHGVDHGPLGYGGEASIVGTTADPPLPSSLRSPDPTSRRMGAPPRRPRPERPPPK